MVSRVHCSEMFFTYFFIILFQVICIAENYNIKHPILAKDRLRRVEEYDQCVFGSYQTPIHVQSHVFEYMVMPAIDFSGYNNYLPPPLTLTNTGRTVKLKAGQYLQEGLFTYPSITGGLLNGQYIWDSLHFHWGKDNDRGSEHVVNNVRYPMEMHVIHIKKGYNSRDEALGSKDGLAVLAFFFEVQLEDNRKLRPIINKLKYVREEGAIANLSQVFSLFTLLPRKTDFFFTYEGSLSSPPCSESVIWIIFPNPIKISYRQMQQFRNLPIPENFRDLQPIGQRKVFIRETKRFIYPQFKEYPRENVSSNLFWLRLRLKKLGTLIVECGKEYTVKVPGPPGNFFFTKSNGLVKM